MNVIEKLRSGHVRRWHIVAVAREQTVAEHMHRVGILTEEILRILGYFSWNSNLTLNAMRWASIHDRPEFKLGDIPTPGKALIRSRAWAQGDILHDAELILEGEDPEFANLSQCVGPGGDCPLAGDIVKYADTLEAMNYVGIFGCGDHAREVWAGLQRAAEDAYVCIARRDALTDDRAGELRNLIHLLKEGHHWS